MRPSATSTDASARQRPPPPFLILGILLLMCFLFAHLSENRQSAPRFRLIFIKTRKTASSTLAAVIRRIGSARGMRFFDPPDLRNAESFRGVLDPPYDIMCNHARDAEWLDTLVPNAMKITILREPISRFLSAWRFFRYEDVLGSLSEFLYRCIGNTASCANTRIRGRPLFNEMAWTLGLDRATPEAVILMRVTNASAPRGFHLVLLAERFAESVVLLSRLLNTSTAEAAYLPLKSERANVTLEMLANLTPSQRQLLSSLNRIDQRLYEAAAERFAQEVHLLGHEFAAQVEAFEEQQRRLAQLCTTFDTQNAKCAELRLESRELTARSAQHSREHRAAAPAWLSEFVY